MNPSSEEEEWRAESIPDEYSADEPIVYSVATTDLSKPTFWFRDEEEATRLAAYLTTLERENTALRERLKDDFKVAAQAVGEANDVVQGLRAELEQSESRAKAAEEERDRLRVLVDEIKPLVSVLVSKGVDARADAPPLSDWLSRAEQEVKQ